ncbi:redoxin domain-containing protein [Bradyrhizobium sp.]|uniref:redoxin domain-containing protein n=1 Tax=Bradyrhizobium sp. TaxID=376 RepID=UPI0025C3C8F3|nr:redoxin domain-containing protein [Bradyrhizobium sp.]
MSKKTRKKFPKKSPKKSPKPASRKTVSRKPAPTQLVKSAKKRRTRTPAEASESAKHATERATKKTANATRKASQKAPSKALKSTGPKAPARSKTAAVKAEAANPAASKPPTRPTDTPAAGKTGLTEGTKAPAFHLPRDGGGTVSLSDYAGKNLVLFFYPRADTPGCTKEAIDFTRLWGAFAESGTALLGVSADPPKAQEAFRDKHELVTPLASDEQHQMLDAYGVWGEKSMYGRTFLGILRTTVLVGADGRIVKVWRNVRVDGHADEVLAAARAL